MCIFARLSIEKNRAWSTFKFFGDSFLHQLYQFEYDFSYCSFRKLDIKSAIVSQFIVFKETNGIIILINEAYVNMYRFVVFW